MLSSGQRRKGHRPPTASASAATNRATMDIAMTAGINFERPVLARVSLLPHPEPRFRGNVSVSNDARKTRSAP